MNNDFVTTDPATREDVIKDVEIISNKVYSEPTDKTTRLLIETIMNNVADLLKVRDSYLKLNALNKIAWESDQAIIEYKKEKIKEFQK